MDDLKIDSDDEVLKAMEGCKKMDGGPSAKEMDIDTESSSESIATSGDTSPPTDSDAEDEAPVVVAPPVPLCPTHDDPLVRIDKIKNGKKIFYNEECLGTLTAWANGISVKCQVHGTSKCRLPVGLADCPADSILVDWLLSCKDMAGGTRLSLEAHQDAKPVFH